MNLFISWSGNRSRLVATALSELLPDVLQDVQPWMSDHDIAAGSRWMNELNDGLEADGFGVLCLTPENLTSPWLLFEAGSLAKSVSDSRVIPFRLELSAADVPNPLAQFQGCDTTRDGTLELLKSVNASLPDNLTESRLLRVFERWWPDFNECLAAIPKVASEPTNSRNDRSLLEEVLEHIREMRHRESALESAPAISRDSLRHPQFRWRTLGILSTRTGLPVAEVKRIVDEMPDVVVKEGRKTGQLVVGFTDR